VWQQKTNAGMDVAWWVNAVTNLMLILAPITFISLLIIEPAPYGR
jgi:hypothetical protein